MEYKRKECWCFEHYQAYYTKRLCHFEKVSSGYCKYHGEVKDDKHGTCEKWCFNGIRRQIRKDVSLKALNKALDNLVEIRQILVDEVNDNKENPIEQRKK